MVRGAQDTLNLEPPSEPKAAGDFDDPVAAQSEGEHSLGSGEGDEKGIDDHDVDAAVVEDIADEKDIATQPQDEEVEKDPTSSQVESEPEKIAEDTLVTPSSPSHVGDEEAGEEHNTENAQNTEVTPPHSEIDEDAAETLPKETNVPLEDIDATAGPSNSSEQEETSALESVEESSPDGDGNAILGQEDSPKQAAAAHQEEGSVQPPIETAEEETAQPSIEAETDSPEQDLTPTSDEHDEHSTTPSPSSSPIQEEETSQTPEPAAELSDQVLPEGQDSSEPPSQPRLDADTQQDVESSPAPGDEPTDLDAGPSDSSQEPSSDPSAEPSEIKTVDEPEVLLVEESSPNLEEVLNDEVASDQPQSNVQQENSPSVQDQESRPGSSLEEDASADDSPQPNLEDPPAASDESATQQTSVLPADELSAGHPDTNEELQQCSEEAVSSTPDVESSEQLDCSGVVEEVTSTPSENLPPAESQQKSPDTVEPQEQVDAPESIDVPQETVAPPEVVAGTREIVEPQPEPQKIAEPQEVDNTGEAAPVVDAPLAGKVLAEKEDAHGGDDPPAPSSELESQPSPTPGDMKDVAGVNPCVEDSSNSIPNVAAEDLATNTTQANASEAQADPVVEEASSQIDDENQDEQDSSEAVLEETPAPGSTVDDNEEDDSGVNLDTGDVSFEDPQPKDDEEPTTDALDTPETITSKEIAHEESPSSETVQEAASISEGSLEAGEVSQKEADAASIHSHGQGNVEEGDQELLPPPSIPEENSAPDDIPSNESIAEGQPEETIQVVEQKVPDQDQEKSAEFPSSAVPPESLSDEGVESDLEDATLATAAAVTIVAVAGEAAHELSTSQGQEEFLAEANREGLELERPRTADKLSGSDDAPIPAEPENEVDLSPEPQSTSSTMPDEAVVAHPDHDIAPRRDFQPRATRRDSSTQTDELWRPKTPMLRNVTPTIVLPDLDDPEAKDKSLAQLSRTSSKRSVQQAEEVVAAAVIIRAAADSLVNTSTRMADVVKDLKQPGDANAPLKSSDGRRGTGDANSTLRVSSANKVTGVDRISKVDEKAPHPPRTREHRSSHGSRSSRPSTRDSASKPHRHSSHRHRHESDRDAEHESPQTPPRTRDTVESGHGSHGSHGSHRSRRERTPQEQADHERRKEERRLAREKDKEREKPKTDSPTAESKGKEAEASPPAERSRRSSRRYSSTRKELDSSGGTSGRTETSAPPQASKKFFDMKSGQSIVDSTFGGPLSAETSSASNKDKENNKDAPLKRSSTITSSRGIRRSLSQTRAKLQKARVEESTKVTKDKESSKDEVNDKESKVKDRDGRDKEHRHRSSDKGPSSKDESNRSKERDDKHRKSRMEKREKEEAASGQKEEKKKSGGLKGMFKKLFS